MNLRGPISQKQFLYVGYRHLEWLLVPPGPQRTTHSCWRWPMKYRTPFIGHMLFIYFYLSLPAFFLFFLSHSLHHCLSLSLSFLILILVLSFCHPLLFSSHCTQLHEVENEKEITFYRTHAVLFFLSLSGGSLGLSLSLFSRQKI